MSEAEKNQKMLDIERAKLLPDTDVIYALKQSRPYWNTVDTERVRRGWDKLNDKIFL